MKKLIYQKKMIKKMPKNRLIINDAKYAKRTLVIWDSNANVNSHFVQLIECRINIHANMILNKKVKKR